MKAGFKMEKLKGSAVFSLLQESIILVSFAETISSWASVFQQMEPKYTKEHFSIINFKGMGSSLAKINFNTGDFSEKTKWKDKATSNTSMEAVT